MYNNIYQSRREPSNRDVWYSSLIGNVDSNKEQISYMDRYNNKLKITSLGGIRVIEFIRKSQLYLSPQSDDQYYFVDASKRYRPDLISQEVYGTPILYWVILSCNNLKNPLELTTGLTLRIPQLASVINNERII